MRLVVILILVVFTTLPAYGSWVRKSLAVAACAASGLDAFTTYQVMSTGRGYETNRFLATPQGKPRWIRIAVIKGSVCAANFVIPKLAKRVPDSTWSATSAVQIGVLTTVSIQNYQRYKRIQSQHRGYLLRVEQ